MFMKIKINLTKVVPILIMIAFVPTILYAGAKIWQESLSIPAYSVGEPDKNPRFYDGRVYQGAQGRIYPYPISDVLGNEKQDKPFQAVYLENDYIKLCILPELGGRIFSGLDKTNNYDFFYRQSVIKPALIGMLGAWISGGVEWNFPHHHRANSFMPMTYTLCNNPDGSKTLWLTEIERRQRMKFLLGITIFPERSYLEVTLKFQNRTPFVQSFLYFANPSVHVDSTYQVIFPPEAEWVTQHAKSEFAEWPIANSTYGGYKYENTDISWWKNLPKPVSFFCWDHEADYFGGYDHGKDAGTVYIGNHHIAPGKKFFTFGCGDEGKMWDQMLTDTDGPYLELMAGAYSDNQPDYSWIQPYEVKVVKQYWYPIRNTGGLVQANLEGALNLEFPDHNTARILLNSTCERQDAVVQVAAGKQTLLKQTLNISPARPFQTDVNLPSGVTEQDVKVTLTTPGGEELLNYVSVQKPGASQPKRVTPPVTPEKMATTEELYLAGLRLDQFHNAAIDPYPFYTQALKRDSLDSRVNTWLGTLYCKRAMYAEAELHLQQAISRLAANYTRPKDGEAYYYLGVVQKAQGKYKEAYDSFYRASWSFAWNAASYYALAELDGLKGDYKTALEHIEQAIATNAMNTRAWNIKSAVLRRLGRLPEAEQAARTALSFDRLDFWAMNELALIQKQAGQNEAAANSFYELEAQMNGDAEMHLELAHDYANAGFWSEAIQVLERKDRTLSERGSSNPLVYYTLGYLWNQTNNPQKALLNYKLAAAMPADYCFPYRNESIPVLRQAAEQNPQDALALCYLGNLLYDIQPQRAITAWEQSQQRDSTLALVHRNLGFAYMRVENNNSKALTSYRKALALKPQDPRLYYEMDVLSAAIGIPPKKRLDVLMQNLPVVESRDDALAQVADLLVQTGQYDKAINLVTTHHFHTWEGGGSIYDVYRNAFMLRGLEFMRKRNYKKALRDFQAALDYPRNLEVGRPLNDVDAARPWYYIGLACENLGQRERAQQAFRKCADINVHKTDFRYYQGLALLKLGQPEQANQLFAALIQTGRESMDKTVQVDFFAKFGERQSAEKQQAAAHFTMALGYLGQGNKAQAKTEIMTARRLEAFDIWINSLAGMLQND